MEDDARNDDSIDERQRLTEVGVGITLVGVMFNMGLTIGFSVDGPLVLRLPLAIGAPVGFVVLLALLSRKLGLLRHLPWALTQEGPELWERAKDD